MALSPIYAHAVPPVPEPHDQGMRVSLTFRCVKHSYVHPGLGYFIGPDGKKQTLSSSSGSAEPVATVPMDVTMQDLEAALAEPMDVDVQTAPAEPMDVDVQTASPPPLHDSTPPADDGNAHDVVPPRTDRLNIDTFTAVSKDDVARPPCRDVFLKNTTRTVFHLNQDDARTPPATSGVSFATFQAKYMQVSNGPVKCACAVYSLVEGSYLDAEVLKFDVLRSFGLKKEDVMIVTECADAPGPLVLIVKGSVDQRYFRPLVVDDTTEDGPNERKYKMYSVPVPNRGGRAAIAAFKIDLLSDFGSLGKTIGNVEIVDTEPEEAVVDAKALDEHYKDFSEAKIYRVSILFVGKTFI